MIRYYKGDERPSWVPTVTINGATDDLSSGYTFTVKLVTDLTATPTVTKTTGITGATGGTATVAWATDELNIAVGEYLAVFTAKRTSDNAEWTVTEQLEIRARP